jgi:uncharacterized protein with HEPN domain
MDYEELKVHYNNLSNLLHQIISETEDIPYENFRKNEALKERVFSQLQEIGEASREVMDMTNE